jgi:hypothetical protein
VEERELDGEPGVVVSAVAPGSNGAAAGIRVDDLITMVKVDSPYQVLDVGCSEDFVRAFTQYPNSTKALMMFREHRPGVVTLPEPIDWLDTPSALRDYQDATADTTI